MTGMTATGDPVNDRVNEGSRADASAPADRSPLPGPDTAVRVTAEERLHRLLHILPAARSEEGVGVRALAEELGTDRETLLRDIDELTTRAYYHPAGSGDDVQIFLEEDRLRVWTTGAFQRPVRLTDREAFCIALALRSQAGASELADAEAREDLLGRIERHLASRVGRDGTRREGGLLRVGDREEEDPRDWTGLHPEDMTPDEEGVRETLLRAARARQPCTIGYLKEGEDAPGIRRIHPYLLAHGEGSWYVVAHCEEAEDIRIFRLDRVLGARSCDGAFTVPDDFDPDDYVRDGKVHDGRRAATVRVRYGPKVARWIRERWPETLEERGDGSVVVEMPLSDPRWVVRHVLRYGDQAEVLEPEWVRGVVREVVG